MDIKQYDRKPFTVDAVQVTPQNVAEVAEWVGGEVVTVPTRMVGTTVDMPAVKVPGKGEKGKDETAQVGSYIVGRKGSFRVYKIQAFEATFEPHVEPENVDGKWDEDDGSTDFVDREIENLTEEQVQSQL